MLGFEHFSKYDARAFIPPNRAGVLRTASRRSLESAAMSAVKIYRDEYIIFRRPSTGLFDPYEIVRHFGRDNSFHLFVT